MFGIITRPSPTPSCPGAAIKSGQVTPFCAEAQTSLVPLVTVLVLSRVCLLTGKKVWRHNRHPTVARKASVLSVKTEYSSLFVPRTMVLCGHAAAGIGAASQPLFLSVLKGGVSQRILMSVARSVVSHMCTKNVGGICEGYVAPDNRLTQRHRPLRR